MVKPRPIAWLFFVGAFATTVGLGTWQIFRLEWKNDLIEQIKIAGEQSPLTKIPTDAAELKTLDFHTVKLSGVWLNEIEYDLAPRYFHDALGYAIITPLQLADGRIILVNRGWIPAKNKDIATRRETIVAGHATVKGMLRLGHERNYFTPKNQPEKDIWFGRDTEEMAAFYQLKNVIPATVDIVGSQDTNTLPVPYDGTIKLRNDHLSYIITWYLIALGVLTIFIVYHRKPR